MENLKTFEEFKLFGRKELTPDEEYKRQDKLHKKEEERLRKKSKSMNFGEDDYTEEEEKKMVRKSNKTARSTSRGKRN